MRENALTTNFEPHERMNFAQTTKIGTHENKALHCSFKVLVKRMSWYRFS